MTRGLFLLAAAASCFGENSLTPEERREGWILLFDGQDTSAWSTVKGGPFPTASWRVEEGCLRTINDEPQPRTDLATREKFRNFEWKFDWNIEPGVNSGVKYLVVGDRPSGGRGPKALGFEMQLLDDDQSDEGKRPKVSTGALYTYLAASSKPAKAPGNWNRSRIRVEGMRVEHWINDVRVLEYRLDSAELREAVAAVNRGADSLKLAHLDSFIQNPETGYPLVLTHHGGVARFRNVKVRKLR